MGLFDGLFGNIGGSSGSSSSTQTMQPSLPPWFGNYGPIRTVTGQLQSGLTSGQIPSPGALISGYPQQGVAPLTDPQQFDINAFQSLAADPFGLNQQQLAAQGIYGNAANVYNTLANFTGSAPSVGAGPTSAETQAQAAFNRLLGGPNVAVPYGQKVFNDMVTPQVSSSMALAGLGNSGALGENLAMAGEAMALPMAEQGLNLEAQAASGLSSLGQAEQGVNLSASEANAANSLAAQGLTLSGREAAGSGLQGTAAGMAGLGSTSFQQGMTNLSNALAASGMDQAQVQKVLDAIYNQRIGQNQLGTNFQQQMMSWIPNAVTGQTVTSRGSNSGFNWGLGNNSGGGGGGGGANNWWT